MTKEEILKKHTIGQYLFPNEITDEQVSDFKKSIYDAMEEYANQKLASDVVSADVSNSVCPDCGSKDTEQIAYKRCNDCYNQFETN